MPQNAANLLMDAMGEGSGNGDKGVEAAMATTTITVPDNIMICATRDQFMDSECCRVCRSAVKTLS